MVNPTTHGHLEPEVLAAYVDHGLSLAERAAVDAHLASCPQCVSLLAGVVRTVAELAPQLPASVDTTEATPFVTARGVAVALGAAAAVLVVVALPSFVTRSLDRESGLVNLVASVSEHRSVLGRLTGGFPHAPLDAPSAGGQDGRAAGADRVLLAADRIRESFGERQTPSQLHARGVADLLSGRFDDAAAALLAASREQPANAKYLNDVATVQLERARRGLRPDDLPRALAAADRAAQLDPSLNEALFNRALALSALSLRNQARAAWTDYLKRDSASPWAVEARTRLDQLNAPSPVEAWASLEGRLQQSIDAATAETAVRTQTTEARNFIENTLLPKWAAAALAGDTSAALDDLRVMADAMQRVTGDALYRDAVDLIDRTQARGKEAVQALAAAHLAYAEAAGLFARDRFADAAPKLTAARAQLAAVGSPFAHRAAVDFAGTTIVRAAYAETLEAVRGAKAEAQARGYQYVEGRASWFEGLVAFAQGRLGDAQSRYDETLAVFERMHDAEQSAWAHNLLSSLFFYLGDKPNEWSHRIEAFKGLSVSRSDRLKSIFLGSAAAALRVDNPGAAITLDDASIAHARAGRAVVTVEMLAHRASTLIALGRFAEAANDITAARAEMSGVNSPQLRQLYELLILAPEGDLQRHQDPAQAVASATRALDIIAARKNPADRSRVPAFQLQLAQANIVWGRTDAAKVALADGIRAFEAERAVMPDEGRLSSLDQSWQLFETAVQIAVGEKDYPKAFEMSERARLRTLAEARRAPAPKSLAEAQAALRDDEAIVALNQFNDDLAVWVIRRTAVTVRSRGLRRADAERLIAQQLQEISAQAAPVASRELFDLIIRPAASDLRGVSRIIVVPDRTYQDTSFAAFWDKSSQRFLVQSAALAISPSVDAYLNAAASSAAFTGRREPLILGGPDGSADANARAIASAYPSSSVVVGDTATRDRLFADAPLHAVVHISARTSPSESNPLMSRLLLADLPGRQHSGAIFGSEIAAHPMSQTHVVVIDDVDTTQSSRGEGTLSLARAFMTAGVPAVVGTLPGANEDATRDLMIALHREIASGVSAEQALLRVQRNAIEQNGRRLGAWSALVMYGSDR